uniref:Endonuclease/exonuclease/phosphatase domain-containing protein n=1 Tax=Monopterus albus TaxID=43700 RepID=A0A3Q3QFM7_MONAL
LPAASIGKRPDRYSILSFNVKCLNLQSKRTWVLEFLCWKQIDIALLQETHFTPKELFRASTVWCRGWEGSCMMDVSFTSILLSATSSMESREQSSTEPDLLTSLLSLFLSLTMLPPAQPTTA